MEFAKQFNEAAQKAVLTKIENGEWVNFPWMEALVKRSVRVALTTEAEISVDLTALVPDRTVGIDDVFHAHGIPPSIGRQLAEAESSKNTLPIGGVVQTYEKPGDVFESNSFAHVEGYDWRIMVSDRNKNHRNSWVENFSRPPTQEEFEYQFRHFHARTHYVHVNYWVDGSWTTITADYVPGWNKEKPNENFTASEEWPEGKKYRIRFFDQRVDRINYVYFDSKPGGIVLNKYHSTKGFAVVEARPEGI